MFSVFTSSVMENNEGSEAKVDLMNSVSSQPQVLPDTGDSEAPVPSPPVLDEEPTIEEQLKKAVFERKKLSHCLRGFDRLKVANDIVSDVPVREPYALEKRFRASSAEDYKKWKDFVSDNEVWKICNEENETSEVEITLEVKPVSEVDFRLAKQRSSRTSVFHRPDAEYRRACLDPNLLRFRASDSPVVPVEATRLLAERNGMTSNSLYLDATMLKTHGVDVSIQEMVQLDDCNQFDLASFYTGQWTDQTIMEAVRNAKVDAAYWISMAFASQLTDNPRDKVISNTIKRIIPHLTMPVVHAMGLTLPHSTDVDELGYMCNVLLSFAYGYEPGLVAQGPLEYAIAGAASAAALFGAYRHSAYARRKSEDTSGSLNDYEERVSDAIRRSKEGPGTIASWLWSKIEFLLSIPVSIKNYIRDFFKDMIMKTFDVLSGGWAATTMYIRSLSKTVLLTGALIVAATGVIAYPTIRAAMSAFGNLPVIPEENIEFVAQGSMNTAIYVMTLITGFSYFPVSKYTQLKEYADWVKHIVTIGSGCNTILSSVAGVVPYVVRRFFFHMFASEEDLRVEMVSELSSFMNRLHECSGNPDVLAVPDYKILVGKAMDQAYTIIEHNLQPKDRTVCMSFNSVFSRLLSVHKHLVGSGEGKSRNLPFSPHFYGGPGVGKTRIACLIAKGLGYNEDQVYKKPKDPFWNAFNGELAILIDEHLVGDTQQVASEARAILDLIGDKVFMPPMASVDNPTVGIKGTMARPELVITMNNSFHTPVNHFNDAALMRRRSCVVQMVVRADAHKTETGDVNYKKYTVEEIRDVSWAAFKFHTSNKEDPNQKKGWMSFSNMMKELVSLRDEHVRIGKKIAIADCRETSVDGHDLGRQLLIRSLNKMGEESSLMVDAVQLVSAGMTAQGGELIEAQGRRPKKETSPSPPSVDSADVFSTAPSETVASDCSSGLDSVDPWEDPPYVEPLVKSKDLVEPNDSYVTTYVMPLVHRTQDFVESPRTARVVRTFMQLGALVVGAVLLAKSVSVVMNRNKESKRFDRYVDKFNDAVKEHIDAVVDDESSKSPADAQSSETSSQSNAVQRRNKNSKNSQVRADEDNFHVPRHGHGRESSVRDSHYYSEAGPTIVRLEYGSTTMKGIGIKDNILMTYGHGLSDSKGEFVLHDTMTLYMGNKNWEAEVSRDDFYFYKAEDIAFVRFRNKRMPMFRNSVRNFVADDAVAESTSIRALFGDPSRALSIIVDMKHGITYSLRQDSEATVTLENAWYYALDTTQGDCGKLLCSTEGKTAGKFIGIHVAGSSIPGVRKAIGTLVTRELVEHAVSRIQEPVDLSHDDDGDDLVSQGNVLYTKDAPRAFVNPRCRSKIKDSSLKQYLSDPSNKMPPVVEAGDPRSDGTDPVENFLKRVDDSEPWVKVDPSLLCDIGDELYSHVMKNTLFPISEKGRTLTIEEAVGGIPGILKGMNSSTSLGLPYKVTHTGKGKTSFFHYDMHGKLHISDEFRGLVSAKLAEIERGEDPCHIWSGALKDEPVSPEKVAVAKTRVVFAGDAVSMTAFRMHFGLILAGFNNPNSDNGVCIGLNQYSTDMDVIFNRLRGDVAERFVAGDFRGFDIHYVMAVVRKAYSIIRRIVEYYGLDVDALDYMCKYDLESPGIIGSVMFKVYAMLFSGGLLTTIINCLVNQLYVRYAFRRAYPELSFDDCVKIVTHGDDHVLNVLSPDVDFDGVVLAQLLAEINQVYTGDDKKPPKPGYRTFTDITFLGSSPVRYKGKYVGRMSKDTIASALSFTNDNDESLVQICQQIGEYASMHPPSYFQRLVSEMNTCFECMGLDRVFNSEGLSQEEIRDIVVARTAHCGFDYGVNAIDDEYRVSMEPYKYSPGEFVAQGDVNSGYMTSFKAARVVSTTQDMGVANASSAIGAAKNTITSGTDSAVPRAEVTWSSSDAAGTILFSATSPWGMVGLGDTASLQNMPFDNNAYVRCGQKMVVQVSGEPSIAGSACAFWYPLSATTTLTKTNWTSCKHVLLSANANTTASLEIPYMFPKPVMNTSLRDNAHVNGIFVIGVLSPLRSAAAASVTISIYSAFPDAEFYLPKAHSGLVAQGNVQTSVVKNEYNVESVVGSMPIQTSTGTDQGATSKNDAVLPMDKPPLMSGCVPTVDQFPGMSRVVGTVPTVGMQMDPTAMYRKGNEFFSSEERKISYLLGLPILHEVREVDTTQVAGHKLITFYLTSLVNDTFDVTSIGANIAILNMFHYWSADVIFDFCMVKTRFHSTRLRFTVGYGETTSAEMVSNPNAYINTILDFSGESDVQSVRVPYNAATQYLRTFSGESAPNFHENESMGLATLHVQNVLTAPDTVNSSVQLLIFLRFDNVSVAVPRPIPFWHILDSGAGDPKQLVAQGEIQETVGTGTGALCDDVDEATTATITDTKAPIPTKPCRLRIGDRFENTPDSMLELARRYAQTSYSTSERSSEDTIQNFNDTVFNLALRPRDLISRFYAAYKGGMNVRFYQHANGHAMPLTFTPLQLPPLEPGDNIMGHITNMETTVSIPTDGTIPASTLKVTSSRGFSVPVAREQTYPIGQGAWIDVTIPYQSELDYMALDNGATGGPYEAYGDYLGLVSIPRHFSDTGNYPDEYIFTTLGDDAAYGIYRPPIAIIWEPISGTAVSENVRTVGTYYNPNSTNA